MLQRSSSSSFLGLNDFISKPINFFRSLARPLRKLEQKSGSQSATELFKSEISKDRCKNPNPEDILDHVRQERNVAKRCIQKTERNPFKMSLYRAHNRALDQSSLSFQKAKSSNQKGRSVSNLARSSDHKKPGNKKSSVGLGREKHLSALIPKQRK